MGKEWDAGLPHAEIWKESLRIIKPGGHLLAFGGTRTYHRLTCAVEDSGWEIRDCLMWNFLSGFPKSHNFGCICEKKMIQFSHEKTTESTTKSSMRCMSETDISSAISTRASEDEVLFEGMSEQDLQKLRKKSQQGNEVGKESGMEGRSDIQEEQGELHRPEVCEMSTRISGDGTEGRLCDGASSNNGKTSEANPSASGSCSSQGSQHKEQRNRKPRTVSRQQDTQNSGMATCEKCGRLKGFEKYGTSLKPAYEPIIVAMKPLDGTYVQNALKWGVAGINIDDSRIGERWPSNFLIDEGIGERIENASRFFYCAKTSSKERNEGLEGMPDKPTHRIGAGIGEGKDPNAPAIDKNNHPTVKPLKLMRYLITLIMPPKDGILLDPFAGSGSTILAAHQLGFKAIGIEKSPEYCEIARKRIENWKPEIPEPDLFENKSA
jgi:hypothetical protein